MNEQKTKFSSTRARSGITMLQMGHIFITDLIPTDSLTESFAGTNNLTTAQQEQLQDQPSCSPYKYR